MAGYVPRELDETVQGLRLEEKMTGMLRDFEMRFLRPNDPPPPIELPKLDFDSALQPFRDAAAEAERRAQQAQQTAMQSQQQFSQALQSGMDSFRQSVMGGQAGMPLVAMSGGYEPGNATRHDKLVRIGQVARASGLDDEGARILQAVATTEGGLEGAIGDGGQSRGPYQFYEGGQMPNFRQWLAQNNIQGDPNVLVHNVDLATQFAASTYLGAAIRRGRAAGLSGSDLATYVQETGQVSVDPWKTGENFKALFGNGQDPFMPQNTVKGMSPEQAYQHATNRQQAMPYASDESGIIYPGDEPLNGGMNGTGRGNLVNGTDENGLGAAAGVSSNGPAVPYGVADNVEPGDFSIPGRPLEPVAPAQPDTRSDIQDPWQRVGYAIRDALQGANDTAVGALNAGGRVLGQAAGATGEAVGASPVGRAAGAAWEGLQEVGRRVEPYTATGMAREQLGREQQIKENQADEQAIQQLYAQLDEAERMGDTAAAEQIRAQILPIEARLNEAYKESAITASERNPQTEPTTTAINIGQGVVAGAIAPSVGSGLVRNVTAGVIDPTGQALSAGIEGVGNAIGAARRIGGQVPSPSPSAGIVSRTQADDAGRTMASGGDAMAPKPERFPQTEWFDPQYLGRETLLQETGVPPASSGKRPNPDQYVYHFTAADQLGAIEQRGLVPRGSDRARPDEFFTSSGARVAADGVYAADNAGILSVVGRDAENTDWALTRFKAGARRWAKDPESSAEYVGSWVTKQPVKPDEIEVWTEQGWRPLIGRHPEAGIVSRAQADDAGRQFDRYYHGTGSDFARPDPGKFDPNGLFGPGYYVTDEPRVAGGIVDSATGREVGDKLGYATARGQGGTAMGANIRPVDVPRGLRLLDADAPVSDSTFLDIVDFIRSPKSGLDPDESPRLAQRFGNAVAEDQQARGVRTGESIYRALQDVSDHDAWLPSYVLQQAGYDGIRYAGGQRIPMMDEAGRPIKHTALVIFPESLDQIRNATAGTPGGMIPETPRPRTSNEQIARFGKDAAMGGVAGGYQASQEEGATPQSIAEGALQGGAMGVARGVARDVLTPRAGQVVSRAVQAAEPSRDDLTHVRGFGILRGVDDQAKQVLERAASKYRQYPDGVGFDEMEGVIKELGISPEDVAKKWANADTRQAASEVETLRRGVAATLDDLMGDVRRISDVNDVNVLVSAADRLIDAAVGVEYLKGNRRAAESAGRTLNQFRNPLDAQIGRQLFQSIDSGVKSIGDAVKVLDDIKTGKGTGARGPKVLERAANSLDELGGQVERADQAITRYRERYVDPLAHQVKVREDLKRTIDNALEKALRREKQIDLKTEVEDFGRQARDIMGRIIENTSDMGLRDDLAEVLGRMREHSNVGEQAANRLQQVFDQRMDTWAKNFMKQVDARNVSAAAREAAQISRQEVAALSEKLREMATLTRSGSPDERLLTGIDDLRIAMMQYGDLGKNRSTEIKQALTKQGLLRFAGKIDEDKLGQFAALLRSIDPERPETLRRVMSLMSKGTITDTAIEYAVANMLSSPSTNMVNISSNIAQGAGYFGVKHPLMVLLDPVVNRGNRQVHASELAASAQGMASAWRTGLDAFGETMRYGYARGSLEKAAQLGDFGGIRREILTERFGGIGAALHAISTRPLQATDEMLGHIFYTGHLYALADRKARSLGVSREQIINNLADNLDLVREAGRLSDYNLLKSKDSLTNAIAMMGSDNAAATMAKHLLFPFVRTPWNVLKQGVEFSPAGTLVNAGKLAGNMATGGDALRRTDLASNVASGLGLATIGGVLWSGGNLSGDGPTDIEKRRMMESEGWRPRSIRVGGQWISYDSTPFTIPLGSLATGMERYQESLDKGEAKGSPDAMWQAIMGMGIGTASSFLNQSFVKNAADIYEDVRQGSFKPDSFLANVATRYIPAGSMVAYLSRLGDSVQRETRMVDNPAMAMIKDRTPLRGFGFDLGVGNEDRGSVRVYNEPLPARQDVLGREMPNDQSVVRDLRAGVSNVALPAPRRSEIREDPVISAFQAAGVDIGSPPKQISIGDGRIKLDLTPDEQRAWQRFRGEFLAQFASDVQSPEWSSLPPIRRQEVLQRALSLGREYAQRNIIAQMDQDPRRTEERMNQGLRQLELSRGR